ncbi:MAG: thermonuclease family protein [Thermodesulfobacteriota bacterium]|nr:thermonuclease family protein [Thermodesulfobacteriota bacterium]
MSCKAYRIILPFLLITIILTGSIHAQTIAGKVVGIADGDTITVLQQGKKYKIRLYGIDTPEKRQDFGKRAKKFTSDMVFREQVRVVQKDKDRYGRVVGMVYVGNVCVNEEIVKAGLAWVYHRYCKDSFCQQWTDIEAQARSAKIGLWSHPDPIPPWDYRRGERKGSKEKIGGAFHGNTSSHVFHKKGCKHFNCKNCTIIFNSRDVAIKAGYRPCGMCKP